MNEVIRSECACPIREEGLDSCALQLPQTPGYKTGGHDRIHLEQRVGPWVSLRIEQAYYLCFLLDMSNKVWP